MRLNIREKRDMLGLTLEEIAKYVGVSKSTVCKWERGFIRNMRRDKIIKLAEILQASPIDFLLSEGYATNPDKEKKVSLNEKQKAEFCKFILSVFDIEVPDSAVIVLKDDCLTLTNSI